MKKQGDMKVLASSNIDASEQEFINLKYNEWRPKMLCPTCKDKENEVILPCGHMQCRDCIEKMFANRIRTCPYDRQKISKNEVIKIYWGGSSRDNDDFM